MAAQVDESRSSCDQGDLVTGVGQQRRVDRSNDTCPEHPHTRHSASLCARRTQKCRCATGGISGCSGGGGHSLR